MNVIIEGPDGVGKSTLVRRLKEHYGVDSIRLSYRDPRNFQFYSHVMEKTDCVFDRLFFSEVVYSEVFSRQCQLSNFDVEVLFEKTQRLHVPTLILDNDDDVILERLKSRGGEHHTILQNVHTLRRLFGELAKRFDIDVIDTTKVGFDEVVYLIDDLARKERRDGQNKAGVPE